MFELTSANNKMIYVFDNTWNSNKLPFLERDIKYKLGMYIKCIAKLITKYSTKGLLFQGPQSALGPEPQQTYMQPGCVKIIFHPNILSRQWPTTQWFGWQEGKVKLFLWLKEHWKCDNIIWQLVESNQIKNFINLSEILSLQAAYWGHNKKVHKIKLKCNK